MGAADRASRRDTEQLKAARKTKNTRHPTEDLTPIKASDILMRKCECVNKDKSD